jgi:hypothetical protein
MLAIIKFSPYFNKDKVDPSATVPEVSVAELLDNFGLYNNADVVVQGEVEEAVGLIGFGSYTITDGTGSIWVITNQGLPTLGDVRSVYGRVTELARWNNSRIIAITESDLASNP